jgi:predicted phosphohydrolase
LVSIVVSRVNWPQTHRLVMSHYPPIDLFDDVADPRDWDALAIAQARTNPRIYGEIGDLSLVSRARRLSGGGAS